MHLTLQRLETPGGGRFGGVGVEGGDTLLKMGLGAQGDVEEWDEKQPEGRQEWG